NVKAFILAICGAVVFAILLVSANTMAMSMRERTREVAVLRTLGFTRGSILSLLLGESVTLSLLGGVCGVLAASALLQVLVRPGVGLPGNMHLPVPTMLVVLVVAALLGVASALFPSYRASRMNIVDGLRYIG